MGGSSAPMPYTPANQAGADSAYYSTLGNLTAGNQATYDTASKGFNDAYSKVVNNPYNSSAMSGVISAANDANTSGQTAIRNAGTMQGFAPSLISYGFDPQGDQYNYGLRQVQDLAKINAAQSGIAGSPFASGLVTDAGANYTRQFNDDRFARAAAALQALGSLYKTSNDLSGKGAQQEGAAAVAPQQTYNDINFSNIAALDALVNGLGTASKPLAGDVQGYGNYLQLGQNSTQIADQATQINNSSSGLLGGLGSLFGMATGGGGTLGGDMLSAIGLFG